MNLMTDLTFLKNKFYQTLIEHSSFLKIRYEYLRIP